MTWQQRLNEWKEKGLLEWSADKKLQDYTTWKIGGPADYMVNAGTIEGLKQVVSYALQTKTPYFVIGNGSNLLICDGGIEGVVIRLVGVFSSWNIEKGLETTEIQPIHVRVGAGYPLVRFAVEMSKMGYSGLEFAGGIPGSIGGAVTMNAGAHGGEIKDILKEVTVLTETGEVKTLLPEMMDFSYRSSSVKEMKYIVLDAVFELQESKKEAVREKTKSFRDVRLKTQPLKEASCGSVFKNPLPRYAGKLIENLELKGVQIGGARISDMHGNFIVNTGGAKAQDVLDVIEYAEKRVKEVYGVVLEREVKVVGRKE